jgi:hypothetical protein
MEMKQTKPSRGKQNFSFILFHYLEHLSLTCLFAATFLIVFWANNLGQVDDHVIVKPLLVILVSTVVLFNLVLLVLRSLPKATFLMLLLLGLFFTYGHMAQVLPNLDGRVLIALYGVIFLILSLLIFRARRISGSVLLFFGVMVMGLLGFNLFKIINFGTGSAVKSRATAVEVKDVTGSEEKPDFYYIVLDAYASGEVLQDVYGFDNSSFLEALQQRGFYLPECPFSNYDSTYDTIASVLNMNYLDTMGISNESLGYITAEKSELIINDQAREIFAQLGYQFVTARGYGPFNDITDADLYLNYYNSLGKTDELSERSFINLFLQTTLVRAFGDLNRTGSPASTGYSQPQEVNQHSLAYEESDFWYRQTNYVFDSLEELPEKAGNYFVYAHINAPHGPYVFNRDGSFRFESDLAHENEYYIDAVVYLNQRVLELIDSIIQNSDTPPVIILQADHGTHYFVNGIEKHKILSAYYLPGELSLQPYDTITPVNDLRLVLHNYFDPSVELLPDVLYVKKEGTYQAEDSSCSLK